MLAHTFISVHAGWKHDSKSDERDSLFHDRARALRVPLGFVARTERDCIISGSRVQIVRTELAFWWDRVCRCDNLQRYEQGCSRRPVPTPANAQSTGTYSSLAAVFLRKTMCAPLSRHVPRLECCIRQPMQPGSSLHAPCVHLCHRCNSVGYSAASQYFCAEPR